jgi:hypothetical protein
MNAAKQRSMARRNGTLLHAAEGVAECERRERDRATGTAILRPQKHVAHAHGVVA